MGEPGIPITVPIWMILSIKYFPVHQLFIVTELDLLAQASVFPGVSGSFSGR